MFSIVDVSILLLQMMLLLQYVPRSCVYVVVCQQYTQQLHVLFWSTSTAVPNLTVISFERKDPKIWSSHSTCSNVPGYLQDPKIFLTCVDSTLLYIRKERNQYSTYRTYVRCVLLRTLFSTIVRSLAPSFLPTSLACSLHGMMFAAHIKFRQSILIWWLESETRVKEPNQLAKVAPIAQRLLLMRYVRVREIFTGIARLQRQVVSSF